MYQGVRCFKARRMLLATGLAVVSVVALSLPALALTYDGTDPTSTGCSSSAVTRASAPVDQGTIEGRFSNNCGTAWARFTCGQSGGCTNFVIWIERIQDNAQYSLHETWPAGVSNGNQVWTNQLNDSGSYLAYACFQAYGGGQIECTASY